MQHAADSRYAWTRLMVSLALMTIGSGAMYVMAVVLPAVQAEFGIARSSAALPYTLMMVGFGVGGILMGRLADRFSRRIVLRVSLDHYTAELHEEERGPGTWQPTLDGLIWLVRHGFNLAIAGRTLWPESDQAMRQGYARLFAEHEIPVDAADPQQLVLFPEMDEAADVPEISEGCWTILGKSPSSIMCASSRMVVKRKGEPRPVVAACTLIPYDPGFTMGETLTEASRPVRLNHPHCARFCVLGGASCSS